MGRKQRALVLQGGGALGAFGLGAFRALQQKLPKIDSENSEQSRQLFDIIAGTSVGAINAAIIVSNFKKNRSWEDSVSALQGFWDRVKSEPDIDFYIRYWDELYGQYPNHASKEAARRYHSAKYFQTYGTNNIFSRPAIQLDDKFFDNGTIPNNIWFRYKNDELRESIKQFADFPIYTNPRDDEPRLLLVSVDIAEGAAVTFDSYDSEQGGVSLENVMASASIPIFYDHEVIKGKRYWDGAILSNTPLREVISEYKTFWEKELKLKNLDSKKYLELLWNGEQEKIQAPDLEAYIVSVWPSEESDARLDHDGLRDRLNDITYSDKTEYDEKVTIFVTDYIDLVRKLLERGKALGLPSNGFQEVLNRSAMSRQRTGDNRKYLDLIKGRFKLSKVVRIERQNDKDSISNKFADFSVQTIDDLITKGEEAAKNILGLDNDEEATKDIINQ
jgi:NTE family protein